jgi:transposase
LVTSVAAPILDDELWRTIEPLLPQHKRRYRVPGRKRVDDRRCLMGILFVLRTGIPWKYLLKEMGCGGGVTCWRRHAASPVQEVAVEVSMDRGPGITRCATARTRAPRVTPAATAMNPTMVGRSIVLILPEGRCIS